MNILHETGIVELIQSNKTGSNVLRQKEKIYLNNPDIYRAISEEVGISTNEGSLREIFFIKMIKNNLKNGFLVKDDITFGGKYEIPLYLFGFLY
jgi:uncharacterized protein